MVVAMVVSVLGSHAISPLCQSRSTCRRLEPAVRIFALKRIVGVGISLPKILLLEPDDVVLLLRGLMVKRFVGGSKVRVSQHGDRPRHTPSKLLGAGIEYRGQILHGDAVADSIAARKDCGWVLVSLCHNEPSLLRPCFAIRAARCGCRRPASGPQPKSSVRSRGGSNRASD